MPTQFTSRISTVTPEQHGKVITRLTDKEAKKREKDLYECAAAVEKDNALQQEMKDWDATLQDGLYDNL